MDINTLNPNEFVDLFPSANTQQQKAATQFASGTDNTDILAKNSLTDTTTQPVSLTDTTTLASLTDTTTLPSTDTDILTEAEPKGGRKPKYNFSDASGWFEDRMKSGKIVKVLEGEGDQEKLFVPKTPEEFDEVLEMHINDKLASEKKNIEKQWYSSKTPAWQVVAKFAEMTDDPAEIIPFIQGVKTIESVVNIDEATVEGAEKIVRTRLEQKGDTPELIQEQIAALKGADKLVSAAKQYKPLIIQEEQRYLTQVNNQKKVEYEQYQRDIQEIEQNAIKAIELPVFGKEKMTREQKAQVYDLIAFPSEDTKGYQIYSKIDELFSTRDFDTLSKIALLLTDKKSFLNYASINAADKTADGLQKKLRVAGETSQSKNVDVDDPQQQSSGIRRGTRYTGKFTR